MRLLLSFRLYLTNVSVCRQRTDIFIFTTVNASLVIASSLYLRSISAAVVMVWAAAPVVCF